MDRPPWWKGSNWPSSESGTNPLGPTQPPTFVGRIVQRDILFMQLLNRDDGFVNIDEYLHFHARENREDNLDEAAMLNQEAAVLNQEAALNLDASLNLDADQNPDAPPNDVLNLDAGLNQDAGLNPGDANENPEGNMIQEAGENVQDGGHQEPGLGQEVRVAEEQAPQVPVEGAGAQASRATPQRAPRIKFTARELHELESVFQQIKYPDKNTRRALATSLGVTETRVQVWFKNKRAKCRRHQRALMDQDENVTSVQYLYFVMQRGT